MSRYVQSCLIASLVLVLGAVGCGDQGSGGGGDTSQQSSADGGGSSIPGSIPWNEYYDDGSVKATGQMVKNADGKWVKQGKFVHYYGNGAKQREGNYENDKKVGEWFQWYPNMDQPVRQIWKDGEVVKN